MEIKKIRGTLILYIIHIKKLLLFIDSNLIYLLLLLLLSQKKINPNARKKKLNAKIKKDSVCRSSKKNWQ